MEQSRQSSAQIRSVKPGEPRGQQSRLIKDIDATSTEEKDESMKINSKVVLGVYALIILLGVGTGYLLASGRSGSLPGQKPSVIKTDTVAGSTDSKTFKDSAEGTLEKGGLDGEGSHKLVREGGPSQTAYLISSVVDLDQYAGKKVRVWGQTMAAKKVSWLMDVGKIEVLSE